MYKTFLGLLISLSVLLCAEKGSFLKTKDGNLIQPGKVVVKYNKANYSGAVNKSAKTQVAGKYALEAERPVFAKAKNAQLKERLNLNNVFLYNVPITTNIENLVEELNTDPSVEYAEPVYISRLEETPNDPLYGSQQHLPQISAPEAWSDQYGSSSVIIGIIDSGVDWDHDDLANIIWNNDGEIPDNGIDDDGNGYIDDTRGWDFVYGVTGSEDADAVPEEDSEEPDNDPMDYDGHGTHVSGIAAAETNNNLGIASVSSGALIMPLRCGWHGNDGTGYVSSTFAAEAYIYAADNGAVITNQSSGNSGQLIVDGAFYAFQNGVLIVESAGNSNIEEPSVLGMQDWVISVASLDPDDVKSSFSNFGAYIDISAPGSNILSTIVNPSPFYGGVKYTRFSGTSMAAPLVASAAGLVKAKYPDMDVIDLYTRLLESADNIDVENPSYINQLGAGKVNVAKALSDNITINPKPRLEISDIVVNETSGNSNNILEPGEDANLSIKIANKWAEGSDVTATLLVSESWPITITDNSETIGNIASVLDPVNSIVTLDFPISCDAQAFPTSQSMTLLLSGPEVNDTLSFNLAVAPKVLFVADFEDASGGELDFSSLYSSDLKSQNVAFDYVHTINTDITYNLLSKYDAVIWGCEWTFPSLTEENRTVLKQYLDNGGSLFLSGQDIGWELNESDDNVDVDFFNNYLKAQYVADDGGFSKIFGVDDDPISDGLSFEFFQINRASDQQYPDVITPIDGATPIFNSENGSTGAIKYSGDYNLVYFSFGGYESILNEEVRQTVLKRIFNWFAGINYSIQKLTDTEDKGSPISVNLTIDSDMPVNSVKLYYNYSNSAAYSSVSMTPMDGSNIFQGIIPPQADVTVKYLALITANNGQVILTETNSFYIGDDITPPQIKMLSNPARNSVNLFGMAPNNLTAQITDNLSIDSTTTQLYYWVNENAPESIALTGIGDNKFQGTFSFETPLVKGDAVSYYFSASDKSIFANLGTSDTVTYMIDSVAIIDDFELEYLDWETTGQWGLSNFARSGNFSLTDSPNGNYESNENSTATYKRSFNLTPYASAEMTYYIRNRFQTNVDSLLFEISSDNGSTWQTVETILRSSNLFKEYITDISDFVGEGSENVKIRFRLVTDESIEFDGAYIDDISIRVSTKPYITSVNDLEKIPLTYQLSQNYPNPFNPSTLINFAVPTKSDVKITVYNILGEVVSVLADKSFGAGTYSISFDAANQLSSGVYIYRISAIGNDGRNFVQIKKMMLLK